MQAARPFRSDILSQGILHRRRGPDGPAGSTAAAAMNIGDRVIYLGRVYYLRGLDPMSVPDRRAELEDVETGVRQSVLLALVEAVEHPESGESPSEFD